MAVSETKIKEQALDPALVERWNSKQELLTPGENITIENGVISAAGGEQKGKPLYFGTCTTIGNTAAKVVECEGFVLEVGVSIMVLFTYRNSTVSPTLNVNNTGAILIKQRDGTSADADSWQNGDVVALTYTGTYWKMNQGYTSWYAFKAYSRSDPLAAQVFC